MEATQIIKYNNNNLIITRFLSESDTQFNQRLEYIKQLEKNNIDKLKVNNLSMIWHCINFKQCKYNSVDKKAIFFSNN